MLPIVVERRVVAAALRLRRVQWYRQDQAGAAALAAEVDPAADRRRPLVQAADAETALYAGFLSDAERGLLAAVRTGRGMELDPARLAFRDPRYRELLFRYRARYFPETLTPVEQENWSDFCRWRLTDPESGYLGLAAFRAELSLLAQQPADSARRALLEELQAWGETVAGRHGLGDAG